MLTANHLSQLLEVAAQAVVRAGQYISNFDRSKLTINSKSTGSSLASQIVTEVDVQSEKLIAEVLRPSCEQFGIAFLAEESANNVPVDSHPRLSQDYFWCVDPLDGTLPFTENTTGYAVSVALVARDGNPVLGAVYDPVTNTLYQGVCAAHDNLVKPGLSKQDNPWQPDLLNSGNRQTLSLMFDRSFTTLPEFPRIKAAITARAIKLGYAGISVSHHAGAVMNAIQVLEQAPACYFKFPKTKPGGGSVWDFAATTALARAAGAWVSDIHGQPLQLNDPETLFMHRHGVLFASDPSVANEVMALYADHVGD